VECVEDMRNAYTILVLRTERKRPLGRSRRIWEDTIKMYLKIGYAGVDCVHLAYGRDQWRDPVNTVMKLQIP